jgi:hypothetical protein
MAFVSFFSSAGRSTWWKGRGERDGWMNGTEDGRVEWNGEMGNGGF